MRTSPLRQRMIGDMTARHFGEKTQKDYIRCVKNLAAFIGRAPETAAAEDLRLYRLHLIKSPLGAASVNSAMTALRFFFSITLDRHDLLKPLFRVEQPRKLPTVLTQEEVIRLLDAAPSAKGRAHVNWLTSLKLEHREQRIASGLIEGLLLPVFRRLGLFPSSRE